MKRMILGLVVLAGMCGAAMADDSLTQDELRRTIFRAEKSLATILKLKPPKEPAKGASQPATRAEITAELDRLFELAKPKFRVTPRPYKVYKEVIEKHNSGVTVQSLEKLVKWGVAAPVGPLVAGPKNSLTLEEYGDALGFFFMQVASLTQQPSIASSPGIKE